MPSRSADQAMGSHPCRRASCHLLHTDKLTSSQQERWYARRSRETQNPLLRPPARARLQAWDRHSGPYCKTTTRISSRSSKCNNKDLKPIEHLHSQHVRGPRRSSTRSRALCGRMLLQEGNHPVTLFVQMIGTFPLFDHLYVRQKHCKF